jgi:hypothetical protein
MYKSHIILAPFLSILFYFYPSSPILHSTSITASSLLFVHMILWYTVYGISVIVVEEEKLLDSFANALYVGAITKNRMADGSRQRLNGAALGHSLIVETNSTEWTSKLMFPIIF